MKKIIEKIPFPYKSFLFSLRKGIKMDDIFTVDKLKHVIKYFE